MKLNSPPPHFRHTFFSASAFLPVVDENGSGASTIRPSRNVNRYRVSLGIEKHSATPEKSRSDPEGSFCLRSRQELVRPTRHNTHDESCEPSPATTQARIHNPRLFVSVVVRLQPSWPVNHRTPMLTATPRAAPRMTSGKLRRTLIALYGKPNQTIVSRRVRLGAQEGKARSQQR